MAKLKPTIIQTILGRPSQSYTFPQDKDFYSTKAHMLRVAHEANIQSLAGNGTDKQHPELRKEVHDAQKHPESHQGSSQTTTVMGTNLGKGHTDPLLSHSHVIGSYSTLDCQDDESVSDEEDVFYTPNTTPRSSMAPSLQRLDNDSSRSGPNESTIATRTPLVRSVSPSSMSSNSLDGHSIFSYDSRTMSDSTRITTPYNSESGHGSYTKSLRSTGSRRSNPDRPRIQPMTYTDEDWAKDVRWLVPPTSSNSSTKSKKRSKSSSSSSSTSYHMAQLPPKQLPSQPQPQPRPRIKPRSKSLSKTNASLMMSMSALLEEEDEDRASQGSQTSERLRTISSPGSAASAPVPLCSRTPVSSSLRRPNPPKPYLGRRKSRSLEDIQVARPPLPDSSSLPGGSSLSSYASSTSYAPSIPSSGTAGYTSLTLPRAPQPSFTPNTAKRISVVGGADGKIDLTRSGIAQTTMATVEVIKGLGGSKSAFGFLSRNRSRSVSAKVVGNATADEVTRSASRRGRSGSDPILGFTSYRKPPDYVPSESVLVQVWAVGVDGIDAKLVGVVSSRTNSGSGHSSGGRSASEASSGKPGLFRSVSTRSKHKRSESDDSNRILGSTNRIEPEVGYIPGRSFVGRVIECGWDVKEELVKKGDWVVGLLDVRKCGALQQFLVVNRHRVYRIPHPDIHSTSVLTDTPTSSVVNEFTPKAAAPQKLSSTTSSPTSTPSPSRASSLSRANRPQNLNFNPPLSLDEYALLPLCGVPAYRAVRTFIYAFGKPVNSADPFFSASGKYANEHEQGAKRRALVLRGHDGMGAIAVQMLVKRGWRVCVHASLPADLREGSREEREYMGSVEQRVRRWGGEEVVFDDGGASEGDDGRAAVVRVIERLVGEGDAFDAVLDTVGGKEIWESSERLLRNTGLSADAIASASALKRTMSLKKKPAGNTPHGTGHFTTIIGDTPGRPIPTAGDHFKAGLRSLKNTHKTGQDGTDDLSKKGNGKIGYAWVSVAHDVDWEGEDVRESVAAVIKMAMSEGVRPWVGENSRRIVPFERTPHVFVGNGPLGDGGTAVVKIVE